MANPYGLVQRLRERMFEDATIVRCPPAGEPQLVASAEHWTTFRHLFGRSRTFVSCGITVRRVHSAACRSVEVCGPDGSRSDPYEALIGSGAENILAPDWVASSLGLELDGEQTPIRIGGAVRSTRFSDVDLVIEGPDRSAVHGAQRWGLWRRQTRLGWSSLGIVASSTNLPSA